jgi:hypothetical protein
VGTRPPPRPAGGLEDIALATVTHVGWFNHRRLHGTITDDASQAFL